LYGGYVSPAFSNHAPGDAPAPSLPPSPPPPPSILIVDDSAPTTRGLGGLFRQAGYLPSTFSKGLEAIAFAEHSRPAGAIVDVHLPDISGLLVSRRLREILGPDVPIVVLSGDTSMEVLNSLPHAGATYFFQKPVSGAMLLERFRGLMRGA
jgi:DNA-binding response OmpR family regulator